MPSANLDSKQDWTYLGSGDNYTECPPLSKCVFQCAASRIYNSEDDEDYDFSQGGTTINFYYGVYYGSDELLKGGITYENFNMPLTGAVALSATAMVSFATLLFAF